MSADRKSQDKNLVGSLDCFAKNGRFARFDFKFFSSELLSSRGRPSSVVRRRPSVRRP